VPHVGGTDWATCTDCWLLHRFYYLCLGLLNGLFSSGFINRTIMDFSFPACVLNLVTTDFYKPHLTKPTDLHSRYYRLCTGLLLLDVRFADRPQWVARWSWTAVTWWINLIYSSASGRDMSWLKHRFYRALVVTASIRQIVKITIKVPASITAITSNYSPF
jgi:hypothetical protein